MQEPRSIPAKSCLSDAQVRLIELMQRINFGRIFDLKVRRGQPVMDPLPRVIRDIKFGGDNKPRPEAAKTDFALKAQVRELFAELEAMGDGVIPCIEIQRGLPFRMAVEEVNA